jgi:SAM-dependent methyltransferase
MTSDTTRTRDRTLEFYEKNAGPFAEKTLILDVSELWTQFTQLVPARARILDVGCGAGRDLKEFALRGFRVVGLDYASTLAAIARAYSGQDVRVADVRNVAFCPEQFNGVWAVASLLHLKPSDAQIVLAKLHGWLRAPGVILTTMLKGAGSEIGRDGRYFQLYEVSEWEAHLNEAGFRDCRTTETTMENITSLEAAYITWLVTVAVKPDEARKR